MFGVSYNLFDGQENLRESIKSIRDSVDYISVVYQLKSNHGNPCDDDLITTIEDLEKENLIDHKYLYEPLKNVSPHVNEITKRNIGYFLSGKIGMNYHMSIDADELYLKDEMEYIKNIYLENNLDSGFCQMLTYYKNKNYILDPPEEYYVSLFYKINDNNNYYFKANVPVLVDPTRKMNPGNFKVFTREEIQMHHYSYVRNNIKNKFINSSAFSNFKYVDIAVEHYNNWKDGDIAKILGTDIKIYKTKYVNYFN